MHKKAKGNRAGGVDHRTGEDQNMAAGLVKREVGRGKVIKGKKEPEKNQEKRQG